MAQQPRDVADLAHEVHVNPKKNGPEFCYFFFFSLNDVKKDMADGWVEKLVLLNICQTAYYIMIYIHN